MKKVLLDTHTAIWFLNGDKYLSSGAKETILDPLNKKYVSIVSAWELAIKMSLRKIVFNGGMKGFVNLITDNGFNLLPIKTGHTFLVEKLPFFHRDPFDRLIIAASMFEDMQIITADSNIPLYPVKCIW
jgi:PIN domain nuclease of toxin-antitoxin system